MSDVLAISHALTRRAAELAVRLAGLVEVHGSAGTGASAAAEFLREWAAAAGVAAPPTAAAAPPTAAAAPPTAAAAPPTAAAPPCPLANLTASLRLSDVELELLLLAGLPEEHEGLADTLRALHPQRQPRLTLGLAALVVQEHVPDRAVLRRLLHEGAATRSGLLELTGEGTFFERSLRIADQVWEALHGLEAWPGSLHRLPPRPVPAGLLGWLELPGVRRAVAALADRRERLLVIGSADPAVAVSRCAALAAAAGRDVVAARVRPDDAAALGLLALHAMLRGAVPVVVAADRPDGAPAWAADLGRVTGPLLLCTEPGAIRPPADRPVLTVPVGPIGMADRRAAWQAALPGLGQDVVRLAARHPLDPAVTALVAMDLGDQAGPGAAVGITGVSAAVRDRAGVTLPPGVELLTPRAAWDRLMLEPDSIAQLRSAVARLEHQHLVLDRWEMADHARADRGVRLLFSGPPGTGKSLAAEVLAAAAATDLLVVDISQLVSKWLGETEKNLAAVFDVAERTRAVLLLDEADALFATRTEVSDSHDRYANLETAWLLQRLDRFDGLAVLATNLRRNIDQAFLRRMDYVLEFAVPGEASRARIWERHLPSAIRADDVDCELLARWYPVPGAWIRNAAIGAAFLAAPDAGPVRLAHLVAAIRQEYAKTARPFPGEPSATAGGVRDERAARLLASLVTPGIGRQNGEPP